MADNTHDDHQSPGRSRTVTHPPRRWRRALAAAVVLGAAGWVVAESVTVRAPRVVVFDGPGSMYGKVATVPQDARLEVLATEGDWLVVRTPDGVEGYVPKKALNAPERGAVDLGGASGSPDAADPSAAAAIKPVLPVAEQYAKNKNLNPAYVDRMVKIRQTISGHEWADFAGQVKPVRRGQ